MSPFDRNTATESVDAEVLDSQPTQRTVDLVPCNFRGTFQNPCFWVLIGIGATLAFQYILAKKKD